MPNPQSGGSTFVGCLRLLIQYIHSFSPYLKGVSCIRSLRTRHAVVTRDPPNMIFATYKSEKKVKLSLCLTNQALRHESVRRSGCIDPRILDLGTSWRLVVSFAPRPLYPRGKSPQYPLNRSLGGPKKRSGLHGEEKILDPTVVQPVASRYTDCAIPAHYKIILQPRPIFAVRQSA
jgi:hypothetical protein